MARFKSRVIVNRLPFEYSQVQLLVTSQDVENYKQIKSDLDQLRSIVEKSELWVYKRQGSEEGMDVGEPEHKPVQYFVENPVCSQCFFFFLHTSHFFLRCLSLMFTAG